MRYLRAYSRSDQARRDRAVRGNGNNSHWYSSAIAMSSPRKLSRRDLLLGAGGFTLAFTILRGNRALAMGSAAPQPGAAPAVNSAANPPAQSANANAECFDLVFRETPKAQLPQKCGGSAGHN